jgi:23S rRNA (guanosine2251-2'-O)-methyltransferase
MKSAEQVYGLHAVAALLVSRPASIKKLMVADAAADRQLAPLLEQAVAAGISILKVARRELDQSVPGGRHQGIVAVIREATKGINERELPDFLAALTEPAFLLVLDGVQDPHNLGACLRTADAAGVHAVIMPQDRAVGITSVVHKVACGAVESVPIFSVTNLARTLRQLRDAGIWIYGTSDEAEQGLYDSDLLGPIALVLGSEGKGMRRLTREHCDHLLSIPMAGQVESLNVSVAAGVVLFEVRRQRNLLAG